MNEVIQLLRNWREAKAGCDHPVCNIGGGPCADCSVKVHDAEIALLEWLKTHERPQ